MIRTMSPTLNPFASLVTPAAPTPSTPPPAPAVPVFTVNPNVQTADDPTGDLQQLYVRSPFFGNYGGYPIPPFYCATVAAADRFINYAKAKMNLTVTMSFDWPEGAFGSGSLFQQNGMVPYLDFPTAQDPAVGHMNGGGVLLLYHGANNADADRVIREYLQLP